MHAIEFMIDNENAEGAKFVAERGCKFTPSAINIFTKVSLSLLVLNSINSNTLPPI